MFFIIRTYWIGSGLSKPYSWRMNAISLAVARRPASRRAGSPLGIASKIRNVSSEITNITATIANSRRTTNLAISTPPLPRDPDLGARIQRVAESVTAEVDREAREDQHDPPHQH